MTISMLATKVLTINSIQILIISKVLGHTVNLHINLHSQLASKDLDGSEQFSLGGADGIRAYPQGEASGSSGYQATAELRYATSIANLSLATFYHWGEVELK